MCKRELEYAIWSSCDFTQAVDNSYVSAVDELLSKYTKEDEECYEWKVLPASGSHLHDRFGADHICITGILICIVMLTRMMSVLALAGRDVEIDLNFPGPRLDGQPSRSQRHMSGL